MSLTSCYRYVLQLPVDTLNLMLRGALSESDGAGIGITRHWEDVPIGSYHATVDVRPADLDAPPPSMTLTATDLGFVLHLSMRIEVDIDEIAALDTIVYTISFDFPGVFERDNGAPPRLNMVFPSVTEPSLNLAISGGEIPLSAELIEPTIHQLYDSDPSLGHSEDTGVAWPGEPTGVMVTTDIYDDEPGAPGFRGAISVQVPDPARIVVMMPGHIKVFGLGTTYVDTDMTLDVEMAVERLDGEIRIKISTVQESDVTVTFANSTLYDGFIKPEIAKRVAQKIRGLNAGEDLVQPIPRDAEVRGLIASQLVDLSSDLVIPVFTPSPPATGEIDLTTFVPATINQQVLALQLVPLADGTPCDTPDVVAGATGFAVSIAKVEVDSMLVPITQENIGDHHIHGYDVTVEWLTGTLCDPGANSQARGHIWIEGGVEVHVDCWDDPFVDFWGPVYLVPSMDSEGRIVFTADAGEFDADDPCCNDVPASDIAALIEGKRSSPIALPRNFSGVGQLELAVTQAEVFAAGVVVQGTLALVPNSTLHASALWRTLYWFYEQAGGG